MVNVVSIPQHGSQLVDEQGRATTGLQLYLDAITLFINADRAPLNPYTVATVPTAASGYGMIMVTDEAGGAVTAFSDLVNWRRTTDRAIVS